MRLLDAEALIYDDVAELVDFTDELSAPPYAILSHTWEQEEVLFADIPLGPQHEIAPSVASVRAQKRRRAVSPDRSDTSSDNDLETESTDNITSDDTDTEEFYAKHTGLSISDSSITESSSSFDSVTSRSTSNTGNSGNDCVRKAESRSISPHVKAGWNKILNACLQTLRDGLSYIWIDTCKSQKLHCSLSSERSFDGLHRLYRQK